MGPVAVQVTEMNGKSSPPGVALAIATAGGAGYLPVAPGTWGSAAALPLFAGLAWLPAGLYAVAVAGLLMLGLWAAEEAGRHWGTEDDSRIVADEVVGQLLALAPLLALRGRGAGFLAWAALVVTGFVAFRVFDVWKPGPARWAERQFPGGAGVMLDDVVAGVLGAGATALALAAALGTGWIPAPGAGAGTGGG